MKWPWPRKQTVAETIAFIGYYVYMKKRNL